MQVMDTHVDNTSDKLTTVEFRGEGGELVSVTAAGTRKAMPPLIAPRP